MTPDFFPTLLANLWVVFLVVFFFGGSIFVHELGHFLAARRRGVHVERFSIGFGPKIFSWCGQDGVEYRLSWIPLGGYVALPQLADLQGLEGESTADVAKLPPLSYGTKMFVFVAGAAFNLLFAFALACIIWVAGQPVSSEMATTRIGYVSATLDLPDGTKMPSPAAQAGLQVGDIVRAIDGRPVNAWLDILQTLITSSGRSADGRPSSEFTIERAGRAFNVHLFPVLSGDENVRRIGIAPGYELIVRTVTAGSPAEKAGLKPDDEILRLGGKSVLNYATFQEIIEAPAANPLAMIVRRAGRVTQLTLPSQSGAKSVSSFGVALTTGFIMTHPSPLDQFSEQVSMTVRTLVSLLNPRSDIGLSKVAGPVGIVRIFHNAAEAGLRAVILFTILVNVNLAIFNLLPIPVLDGGQMLFATIARLRGRPLPVSFVAITQSTFIVLLFSMVIYVSFFDVRRLVRDTRDERPKAAAPAK